MREMLSRLARTVGRPPGTLHAEAPDGGEAVRIDLIAYGPDGVREETYNTADAALDALGDEPVHWINVSGIHDTGVIETLGRRAGLHPLAMEDIANPEQRPKLEEEEGCLFFPLKMVRLDAEADAVLMEQVALVVADGIVLSFQEVSGDVFDSLRERIRTGGGRVRTMGADYLGYLLVDLVVDGYYVVLETVGRALEEMEERAAAGRTEALEEELLEVRRDLLALRRTVWPLREALRGFEHSESPILREGTRAYLRDVYEHGVQVMETVEALRELAQSVRDVMMTAADRRLNEVLKVLTMIGTIFIPLSFIAGVFGMNFRVMWPTDAAWGFPVTLAGMALLAAGMFAWFRRKGWL
jgi:magnesium transporter